MLLVALDLFKIYCYSWLLYELVIFLMSVPPCSQASAGEEMPSPDPPSRGHLVGRVGGRGDKGADVGDASTAIMEAGPPTLLAWAGWPH